MNFHSRLAMSGVSASVLNLVPADLRQARRLSNSFERIDGNVVDVCLNSKQATDKVRRGAEAFAIWLAARRFVAVALPGRNEVGCLLSQAEALVILLAQMSVGDQKKHPAFKGVKVADFMQSVRDAFDAYALDMHLNVHHDKSAMSAEGMIDDDEGGCTYGTSVNAKNDELLSRPFRKALFERCRNVKGKQFTIQRMLFDRVRVDESDWQGILDYMAKPTPRKRKQRPYRRPAPRPLFADLMAAAG